MHFWHNEVIFDVMAYVLTSQRISWCTFWYYNIIDLMNKQYYLTLPRFIYIYTDEGFARFGIIWIMQVSSDHTRLPPYQVL